MSRWSRYDEGLQEEIEREPPPIAKADDGPGGRHQKADTVVAALDAINATLSNAIVGFESETFRKEQDRLAKERLYRSRNNSKIAVRIVGVLAVLAAAAAVLFAAFQGVQIRKQLAAMSGQLAGMQQAQSSDNRILQRAFVSTKKLEISEGSLGIRTWTGRRAGTLAGFWLTPVIENSGNTPTRNLSYQSIATCASPEVTRPGQLIRCDQSWPNGIPSDPAEEKAQGTRALLAPHSAMGVGGIGVSADTLRQAANGGSFYVYGAIRYQDVFPDTRPHLTEYCYQVSADVNRNGYVIPKYSMCSFWNCADEECDVSRSEYANLKSQVAHHK